MAKKFKSKKGAERVSLIVAYTVLIIICLIWLIPFLMLIILSFRTSGYFGRLSFP